GSAPHTCSGRLPGRFPPPRRRHAVRGRASSCRTAQGRRPEEPGGHAGVPGEGTDVAGDPKSPWGREGPYRGIPVHRDTTRKEPGRLDLPPLRGGGDRGRSAFTLETREAAQGPLAILRRLLE